MGNLWLKIKVWTKVLLLAAVIVYAALFVVRNSERTATFWYWFDRPEDASQTTVLRLVLFAFLTGVVGTLLVRTTFVTLRQMREMRQRSRTERMQRELEDMKAKAAMLRTKPADEATAAAVGDRG